jgi:integrase
MAVSRAKPGLYADGGNLYLQVSDAGTKSWLFRYAVNGRERYHGLGATHTVSLAEARDAALQCRKWVREGIDPIEHRKRRRQEQLLEQHRNVTFQQVAEAYMAAHAPSWRSARTGRQWRQSLTAYVYPVMGRLPVQEIDTALLLKILRPIWQTKAETASRVRNRIELILDSARAAGHRTGDNPAKLVGHLDKLLPAHSKTKKVTHFAAVPYEDVGRFITELRNVEGNAARALEFVILTAARISEVLGMTWREVDLSAKVWTVSAGRMKSNREHRVPLSAAALAVLARVGRGADNEFVFPSQRGRKLVDTLPARLIKRLGYAATTHGFRSSFRDWAGERTNFPREVAEAALAHVVGDRVEAAYRRGDLFEKRRRLMDAWAEFCGKPVGAGKVVAISAVTKRG